MVLTRLLILIISLAGVSCFRINRIVGPISILNGSVPRLVLDCQYDATRYDTMGLTVKWFFKKMLVYQWIPNSPPQGLNFFKGKVDTTYKASNHSHEIYRALAIRNPTTEHSGDYTCMVSTFQNDDHMSKKVIIYAPADDIYITYTKPSADKVKVICIASGLFPSPQLQIYSTGPLQESRIKLPSTYRSTPIKSHGGYNASVESVVYHIDDERIFECRVTIPGTYYAVSKNIIYYPGATALESTSLGNRPQTPPLIFPMGIAILISSQLLRL